MEKSAIVALFAKYKRRECTEEEVKLLHEWLDRGNFDTSELAEEEVLADLKRIADSLPLQRPRTASYRLYRIIGYAASVILIIGLAYYYYQSEVLTVPQENLYESAQAALDPGTNKAVLRLDDGSSMILDTLSRDKVLQIDGASVQVNANGQLVYLPQQTSVLPKNNQLITPRGGQYEVVLPDGTQVWLNSASRLSFVNDFTNQSERRVELEGEAYFHVSRNVNKPFVVAVGGQTIKVLGTEFNVNAYVENKYIKTSLLEGAVLFNDKPLVPGESAVFKDNRISVRQENIDDIIAWKNGYFVFFEENLEEVMKKISRWYDLDVTFAGNDTKTILFGGSISKYENAVKVFRMIEKAGNVKINVHGRKIVINKM